MVGLRGSAEVCTTYYPALPYIPPPPLIDLDWSWCQVYWLLRHLLDIRQCVDVMVVYSGGAGSLGQRVGIVEVVSICLQGNRGLVVVL